MNWDKYPRTKALMDRTGMSLEKAYRYVEKMEWKNVK